MKKSVFQVLTLILSVLTSHLSYAMDSEDTDDEISFFIGKLGLSSFKEPETASNASPSSQNLKHLFSAIRRQDLEERPACQIIKSSVSLERISTKQLPLPLESMDLTQDDLMRTDALSSSLGSMPREKKCTDLENTPPSKRRKPTTEAYAYKGASLNSFNFSAAKPFSLGPSSPPKTSPHSSPLKEKNPIPPTGLLMSPRNISFSEAAAAPIRDRKRAVEETRSDEEDSSMNTDSSSKRRKKVSFVEEAAFI